MVYWLVCGGPNQFLHPTGMETLVAFTLAEMALVAMRIQAQETLIQKWKKGELSLEQLKQLKTRQWFQRRFLKPMKIPSLSKKND
jgi:hypothetical protein